MVKTKQKALKVNKIQDSPGVKTWALFLFRAEKKGAISYVDKRII